MRGTQARTPLAGGDAACQRIHPSVAERSKQGAACVPQPYTSGALANVNLARSLSALTPVEKDLMWTAQDIRSAAAEHKPRTSIVGLVLGTFGGG